MHVKRRRANSKITRSCTCYATVQLRTAEGVEPFVRVPNEGQTHLGLVFLPILGRLCAEGSRVIILIDFLDREVRDIDARL